MTRFSERRTTNGHTWHQCALNSFKLKAMQNGIVHMSRRDDDAMSGYGLHLTNWRCWQDICSRGLWYAMSTLSYPLWTTQTLTFVPKALWYTMSMLLPTVNNQDADISSTGLVVCYVNTSPTHCKQRKCWHLFQRPCGRLCQYFSNPLWTTMLLTFVPKALW